ncbi:MAG: pyridoxamine 5'-phosphate oxidase [Planctomycetes bacterium]|nr:pyridoxamine 5'-phosphate oxidase [Planctomycetota bacterium]
MSIADLRKEYSHASLDERDAASDPIVQFELWFEQAVKAELPEPNAMTLATATREGVPSARIVLLKGVGGDGFTFYTNYDSRKGRELEENPHAALVFHWVELERQVRVTGLIAKVSREESEAYFHTRPRTSQIGAWASEQSKVLEGRFELEKRVAWYLVRYAVGAVPLPPNWGGYRLMPGVIEFWQGRPSRLHDRLRYVRQAEGAWKIERLSP